MKKIIIFLIAFSQLYVPIITSNSYAKHLHKERVYQEYWAEKNNAVAIEYILPDRARVDIVTEEYAIEVDFAYKWAEAVGQSLYYAEMMKLKPGIVLIVEDIKKFKLVFRLKVLTEKYNIRLWIITPDDLDFSVMENK